MSDNDLAEMGREQIAIMRAVEQERSLGAHRLARIAELERAAETSRANYTLAFAVAAARIRELESERDELLGLVIDVNLDVNSWGNGAAGSWLGRRDAIVARIEKATKATP